MYKKKKALPVVYLSNFIEITVILEKLPYLKTKQRHYNEMNENQVTVSECSTL